MAKKRYLGPKEYIGYMSKLCEKVKKTGYNPDVVLAIMNGGYYPAKFISDALNIPMLKIGIKSYNGQQKGNTVVYSDIDGDIRKYNKILVVDDLAETGKTIKETLRILENKMKEKEYEVKTATIFLKPQSEIKNIINVEVTNEWIVFPYEVFPSLFGPLFNFYFNWTERKAIEKINKQ